MQKQTEMVEEILKEAALLRHHRHANILYTIGVSWPFDALPVVVLPLMAHGDLRSFLCGSQVCINHY